MGFFSNLFGSDTTDDHGGFTGHVEKAPRGGGKSGTWTAHAGSRQVSDGHASRREALKAADRAAQRADETENRSFWRW